MDKLVKGSKEKSTDDFFDVTNTWFEPTSDETADKVFRPETMSSEGDIANEGDTVNEGALSPTTQVSEGATMPSQS